ncbi:MAG: ATP-dependent DNA helicase RecQ, partial [Proteobacteria bacterium]|nr:ATP-dependent DNA helicase RecQ [Pseudomonadota bacterium]
MGTGSGKSLIFQLAALILEPVTLVVSPTISLMMDQVARFNPVPGSNLAACINSTQSSNEVRSILGRVRAGKIRLLYVAPERLASKPFLEAIQSVGVSLLVVDDAHCVLSDGVYREHYLRIGHIADRLGIRRRAAFTATSPKGFATRTIRDLLGFHKPRSVVRDSLNRRNLYYSVTHLADNGDRTVELVRQLQSLSDMGYHRGIIYCARVRDVPIILRFVRSLGLSAVGYHGQMHNKRQRQRNLERFASGNCQIMVATKAFEVGIDVPDVR